MSEPTPGPRSAEEPIFTCGGCGTEWETRQEASDCASLCQHKIRTWDNLLAACEAAVRHLNNFAEHPETCSVCDATRTDLPCDCGLDDTLAIVRKARDEARARGTESEAPDAEDAP